MTVDATEAPPRFGPGAAAGPAPRRRPQRRGRLFGVGVGQIVMVQVAAALLVAGIGRAPVTLALTVLGAAVLLAAALVRVRGRWAYEWAGAALRYAGRRHALPAGAPPGALLDLLSPGTQVTPAELAGDAAAVFSDAFGLTAVLELGDPTGLLAEPLPALPSPLTLLPPPGPESPPTRVQLVLTGVPAPALRAGTGTSATSYRQLTDGRLLGHARAVLVVRVLRAQGWSDDDLRRSLSGLVRKLPRRLPGVPVRALGEAAVLHLLTDLAHHDPGQGVREGWSGLQVGGLVQATYLLRRWPDLRTETARRLVTRLLALPTTATTVAVTAGPWPGGGPPGVPVELTVRLAAVSDVALATAAQALRKLLVTEEAEALRLDGDHLPGLTATLPLGGDPGSVSFGAPARNAVPPDAIGELDLSLAAAGLMLGNNRHGAPVIARLFRPEQTRAVLLGAVGTAQLVTLRAMGLGARVVVQTARPQLWEPFVSGASMPGESITVVPPGRALDIPAGTALHPLLVVVDVGPVGADPQPGRGWQATLVVREDFGAFDVDVAARADLLIMQRLHPQEAALVGSALGLGEAAEWLTRIREDMVGVVHRRSIRWALLAPTPIEHQLTGSSIGR